MDVIVIGAGPAGVLAASRAAELGERAVELAQLAAVAMASEATVDVLARVPLSFPTYANVLGRAAIDAAHQLDAPDLWDVAELAGPTPTGCRAGAGGGAPR